MCRVWKRSFNIRYCGSLLLCNGSLGIRYEKISIILGLCILFFIISANIDYAESESKFDYSKYIDPDSSWNKKQRAKKFLKNITGMSYFEKRKECQAIADRMDTVRIGKIRYKECMDR